MTLYLFKFNNYYNRIIKKYDTIDEYGTYLAAFESTNFIPNDGIYTEHIVNYSGEVPDYLIIANENNEIVSRWYIISSKRTRAGQYKLDLYRDVIVDWYDNIIDAPTFIEKAILDIGNPLIYNNENVSLNKIKKEEILLKDVSNCPWIVGYLASDAPEINTTFSTERTEDITVDSIQNWEWYKYSELGNEKLYSDISSVCFHIYANANYLKDADYLAQFAVGDLPATTFSVIDKDGLSNAYEYFLESGRNTSLNINQKPDTAVCTYYLNRVYNERNYSVTNALYGITAKDYFLSYLSNIKFDSSAPLELNNKVIYETSTNKRYRVSVKYRNDYDKFAVKSGKLFDLLSSLLSEAQTWYNQNKPTYIEWNMGMPNTNSFGVRYTATWCEISIVEINQFAYKTKITAGAGRTHLIDAPYDMFCLPYSDDLMIKVHDSIPVFKSSKDINLKAALSLATDSGGSIWDLQLVPYCPIQGAIKNGQLDISSFQKNYIYRDLEELTNPIGAVIYCPYSKFSFDIPYIIEMPTDPIEVKVKNDCEMYRLCSPNFSGMFEFNPMRNNGIQYFNVDCQYKPFQPYIHINPNFDGLYGQDFDDARGLICGGDFSLPLLTDAWRQYELQNKNYQKQFDRQINNLEIQHMYGGIQDFTNAVTGTLQGAGTGAMMGNMISPGSGGVIGAAIGGATSLAGGIADVFINNELRRETLDYTKDMFGLQLDNIKALPESLTRVSAFNNNNKIFPFLEVYSCTDIEKEAFKNKLKYNGFTVGIIGTLKDYIRPDVSYIKGKLIRLENTNANFEIVNTIANELNKGVFI